MKLSAIQRATLACTIRETIAGRWYRATTSGERVTLASLYYNGLLDRRAWRGIAGHANAAYEYQATEQVIRVLREMPAR